MPIRLVVALVALLSAAQVYALEWVDDARVAQLFRDAGVQGTFVLFDTRKDRLIGHHEARARTPYVPASTFKVPHTLIGLATGAVRDVDEVLPYGGKPQPFKTWERDMALREAIALSNVPIYQALARRIGLERERAHLIKLGYGNAEVGEAVDRFWLDGPLRISAVEQAQFLARLANGELPYAEAQQHSVREIIFLERCGDAKLYEIGRASCRERVFSSV